MIGPQQYLCRCTEPHAWGGHCAGRAETTDDMRRSLLARLEAARTDPGEILDAPDGTPFPEPIREVHLSVPDAELLTAMVRALVDGTDAAWSAHREQASA